MRAIKKRPPAMDVTPGHAPAAPAAPPARIMGRSPLRRTRVSLTAEAKSKYLALQQDADFALWRAREANQEARTAYQRHLQGQGDAPSEELLEQIRQLEQLAETKYRELRTFVREQFDGLVLA